MAGEGEREDVIDQEDTVLSMPILHNGINQYGDLDLKLVLFIIKDFYLLETENRERYAIERVRNWSVWVG